MILKHKKRIPLPTGVFTSVIILTLAACAPTVKVEAPEKPITINLNVKIEHEVRVKLEQTAEAAIENNEELF